MASIDGEPCGRCGAVVPAGTPACTSCGTAVSAMLTAVIVGPAARAATGVVDALHAPTVVERPIAEIPTVLDEPGSPSRAVTRAPPGDRRAAGAGAQDLVDSELGGCRIGKKIGQGGMGAVYLAHHIALDIPVAVKVILPHVAALAPSIVDRFLGEARAAARLQHANVVSVLNTGEERGVRFIVMQFVDGETVEARLRRETTLPLVDALGIITEVARGLAFAHERGIVHRDIKPANVLIGVAGEVKIADLGLAKREDDDAALTGSGVGMGTPHYMAPEQALDPRNVDGRSDLYSLGCMLYQMITGRVPFEGPSSVAVLNKHIHSPLPDTGLGSGIPPEIAVMLRRMLAKDPGERYPSAVALLADLDRARTQAARAAAARGALPAPLSLPSTAPGPSARRSGRATPVPVRATPGDRRPVYVAAALLLVLLGWFAWWRGSAPSVSGVPEAGAAESTAPVPAAVDEVEPAAPVAPDRDLETSTVPVEPGPSAAELAERAARDRADREQMERLRAEYQRSLAVGESVAREPPVSGGAVDPAAAYAPEQSAPPPRETGADLPPRHPPPRHPPLPSPGAPPPGGAGGPPPRGGPP